MHNLNIRTTAIIYNGRSGSYLLSNLLDSAPDILSCPPDSLANCLPIIQQCIVHSDSPKNLASNILTSLPNLVKHKTAAGQHIGADSSKLYLSLTQLFEYYKHELVHCNQEKAIHLVFVLIHIAYAIAIGRDFSTARHIMWQQHIPISGDQASAISRCIPDIRFLICVREPIATIDSHIYHKFIECRRTLHSALDTISSTYYLSLALPSAAPNISVSAIKFEDLHLYTEATLQSLCASFSIEYHPCMLDTTIDGYPYLFKTTRGNITGTNSKLSACPCTKVLHYSDVLLLESTLYRVRQLLSYCSSFSDEDRTAHVVTDYPVFSIKTIGYKKALAKFAGINGKSIFPPLISPCQT